ncbi:Colipase [Varanus komodoensis]|nr:Colipase [Varanus komodoensis]
MGRTWVLLLLTLALTEGLFFNLKNGELCGQSIQCKSRCCHRVDGLSLGRCADKAAENQECSRKHLYGIYYKCPCENGLTCKAKLTIGGIITNTDFGICKDQAK